MTPRAIIGTGDLPLLVRAERVPLSLTRQSVELACEVLGMHLERVDEMISETYDRPAVADSPEVTAERAGYVALRIALIDALAELRGER